MMRFFPTVLVLVSLFLSVAHADSKSDFKCGMTLTRYQISPTNFFGSGENLLIIPGLHEGQRGFYALDETGVKFHPLPPERAVKKNDRFYYHRFSLEDPKTKEQARIVYSDIIADPDEAITVTIGPKDKRPFPLSVGVPVNDERSQAAIRNRFMLSLKSIPPMVESVVQREEANSQQVREAISSELSQILCTCGGVASLKHEVDILRLHPALVPFKVGTC
jgi:hypothetical protein